MATGSVMVRPGESRVEAREQAQSFSFILITSRLFERSQSVSLGGLIREISPENICECVCGCVNAPRTCLRASKAIRVDRNLIKSHFLLLSQ